MKLAQVEIVKMALDWAKQRADPHYNHASGNRLIYKEDVVPELEKLLAAEIAKLE